MAAEVVWGLAAPLPAKYEPHPLPHKGSEIHQDDPHDTQHPALGQVRAHLLHSTRIDILLAV